VHRIQGVAGGEPDHATGSEASLSSEQIEDRRQIEHLVPFGLVFLFPYLNFSGILILGGAGLAYVLYVSPRLVRVTTRREERRRVSRPKLNYAMASLAALLVFHDRIHIAAGAFALLAVGDAISNLVGRKVGGPRLPFNPRKTLGGSLAFWALGGLAAWVALLWNVPAGAYSPAALLAFSFIASAGGALIESLPQAIDDNISIIVTGSVLLYLLFSVPGWRQQPAEVGAAMNLFIWSFIQRW
jgi:dolichol kinase